MRHSYEQDQCLHELTFLQRVWQYFSAATELFARRLTARTITQTRRRDRAYSAHSVIRYSVMGGKGVRGRLVAEFRASNRWSS